MFDDYKLYANGKCEVPVSEHLLEFRFPHGRDNTMHLRNEGRYMIQLLFKGNTHGV